MAQDTLSPNGGSATSRSKLTTPSPTVTANVHRPAITQERPRRVRNSIYPQGSLRPLRRTDFHHQCRRVPLRRVHVSATSQPGENQLPRKSHPKSKTYLPQPCTASETLLYQWKRSGPLGSKPSRQLCLNSIDRPKLFTG